MIKLKDILKERKILKEFDDYGMESITDKVEELGKLLNGFAHDVSQDLDSRENRTVSKALNDYKKFFQSFVKMYKTIN